MLGLDSNWKFKDVQDNVEMIITRFEEVLSSFFWKERGYALHKMKQEVFRYENIQYWQRERLWEVLNDDFTIEEFKRLGQ